MKGNMEPKHMEKTLRDQVEPASKFPHWDNSCLSFDRGGIYDVTF